MVRSSDSPSSDPSSTNAEAAEERFPFLSPLSSDAALEYVCDKRVLILVHGFNTSFQIACDAFGRIAHRFRTHLPNTYDRIVGFTWPGGSASYHYFSAKRRVTPAAHLLRRWLTRFRIARSVDVLAHSLGSRVVREALHARPADDNASTGRNANASGARPTASSSHALRIRNLFAVAPALRRRDMKTVDTSSPVFCRAFLFYTRNDSILGRLFPLFEWDHAIGYAGPEGLPDFSPPGPVTAVNCDGVVDEHVGYLDKDAFYQYVAEALEAQSGANPVRSEHENLRHDTMTRSTV